MSRQTLFSWLLAALLAAGLAAWSAGHTDDCDRYRRGDRTVSPLYALPMGKGSVAVPCTLWPLHQPVRVQVACAVLAMLVLVGSVGAVADVQRSRARARQRGW